MLKNQIVIMEALKVLLKIADYETSAHNSEVLNSIDHLDEAISMSEELIDAGER